MYCMNVNMCYVVYCQRLLKTLHSSLHEAFDCIVIYFTVTPAGIAR